MQRAAKQIPLFPDTEQPDTSSGFSVRQSGRARRLSIKVYPRGKVEVVVPKRTRAKDVEAFVAEHRDWITRTRAAFAEKHPPEPFRLPVRIELAGIERMIGVNYVPKDGGKGVRYRQRGDILTLTGNIADPDACIASLKRWLSGLARKEFEPRLKLLSAMTGQPYKRMRVAGQKTCWGSHSSSGTISINYCLLFLKPELVRYLMIHELCHASHMNHSRRFWGLVGRHEPQYRRFDKRLSDAWTAIPAWVGIY